MPPKSQTKVVTVKAKTATPKAKTATPKVKNAKAKTAVPEKPKVSKPRAPKKASAKPKITKPKVAAGKAPKAKPAPLKPAASAVLLSGGNPQIPKGDGNAPVQAYIKAMPGWKREVGRRLDALVLRVAPQARKAIRWNSPFYGIEGQGWFLSFHCFDKYLKVVFLRGASLTPLPPVASKLPTTRYYHIFEGDTVDEKQLTDWIRQAAAQPGDPIF